jgi:3'-5' exonuclease
MRTAKNLNINSILFLDIETAPQWEKFSEVPDFVKKEWVYKFKFRTDAPKHPSEEKNPNADQKYFYDKYEQFFADLWENTAGLYPEFSKIICLSAGYFAGRDFRLVSFYDQSEEALLKRFCETLSGFTTQIKDARLCAHYGKGFDFPFIGKRLLIHRLPLPSVIDTVLLPKWENKNIDTHELWQFGDFKNGGTLGSIAMAFGIPSPKDDIEGSDVARVYYEGGIDRIVTYCEKDVITLAKVFKCFRGEDIENINIEKVVL